MTGTVFAQSTKRLAESETQILPMLFPVIDSKSLSLGAADIADRNNPGRPWVNPAGLETNGNSFYVEFGRNSESQWFSSTHLENQTLSPVFACFSKRIAGHDYAVGHGRYYSMDLNMSFMGTTIAFGLPSKSP